MHAPRPCSWIYSEGLEAGRLMAWFFVLMTYETLDSPVGREEIILRHANCSSELCELFVFSMGLFNRMQETVDSLLLYMQEHQLLLVTAESCTAGLIAAKLGDAPGAGKVLDCAFVTYSPQSKRKCLGVSSATIDGYGLTSEEVSIEMALGALDRSLANVAIANTGVSDFIESGPPAGTQCFAWAFKKSKTEIRTFSETRIFSGTRGEIRGASADFALAKMVQLHKRMHISLPVRPE